MAEIITLSSDEEEPCKKRVKLTTISSPNKVTKASIILSDDDDDIVEVPSQVDKSSVIIPNSNHSEVTNNHSDDSANHSEEAAVNNAKAENGEVTDVGTSCTEAADVVVESDFDRYVKECLEVIEKSSTKSKVISKLDIVKKVYEKVKRASEDLTAVTHFINKQRDLLKTNPQLAVVTFCDVFEYLKAFYKEKTTAKSSESQSQRTERHIRNLQNTLKKLQKKIRTLEEAEINFEDEQNSSYLQLGIYMNRASQVYSKLCKLEERNPYMGRILYQRLDFNASDHSDINRAISKKFRDQFPTAYDMDKLVRNCVKKFGLGLTETQVAAESRKCFEALGKLKQRRRLIDYHETQRSYIENTVDPAVANPEIAQKLVDRQEDSRRRMDQVMEKYSRMQEEGLQVDLSSDSDDSNNKDSELDENAVQNS